MRSRQDSDAESPAPKDRERRYLIAAGTAHYKYLPEDAQLPSVRDDVQRIVDCFSKLGYKRALAQASKDPRVGTFRRALGKWFLDDRRSADDKVVFYYSGHGESEEDRHYLILSDTTPPLVANALPAEDIIRFVDQSPVQQALIILDTCHSGRGINDLSAIAGKLEQRWDLQRPFGLIFVAATRAKQEATQGAFAGAFADAVLNEKLQAGGKNQQYLDTGPIVETIKVVFEKDFPEQTAVWNASSMSGISRLIPNVKYEPDLPAGLDPEFSATARPDRTLGTKRSWCRDRVGCLVFYGPRSDVAGTRSMAEGFGFRWQGKSSDGRTRHRQVRYPRPLGDAVGPHPASTHARVGSTSRGREGNDPARGLHPHRRTRQTQDPG